MTQPILIMGATSGIGALAVTEALSRGLTVRAFARGADTLASRQDLFVDIGCVDGFDNFPDIIRLHYFDNPFQH